MDTTILQELAAALAGEHDKLVSELKSFATEDPHMKGNWNARFPHFEIGETGSHASLEEEADEVEDYETRLEMEHTLESRLLEVNRALQRMQQGTYGICSTCKKEISLDRLRANPAAAFDIEHSR